MAGTLTPMCDHVCDPSSLWSSVLSSNNNPYTPRPFTYPCTSHPKIHSHAKTCCVFPSTAIFRLLRKYWVESSRKNNGACDLFSSLSVSRRYWSRGTRAFWKGGFPEKRWGGEERPQREKEKCHNQYWSECRTSTFCLERF